MIPLPKLDDRKWEDLVNEAVSLIPKYCPDWTNHNASDPGITLIELFAWLVELMLFRLNRVTDKNYLAFLDLMGIELQPPQPSHVNLTFSLVPGAKNFQVIPAGTSVATDYKSEESPIVFETLKDLVVLPTSIVRCYSQFHDAYANNTESIHGRPGQSFEAFMGCQRIERYFYLLDSHLEALSEEAILLMGFETPESPDTDFPSLCEWEYWNGHRWRELEIAPQDQALGWVAFLGVDGMEPVEINEIEGYWIRGRLVNVPANSSMTVVERVYSRIEILGEGVSPEHAIVLAAGEDYLGIDLSKNFYPFYKEPTVESCFYIASDELLRHPSSRVRIDFELSDAVSVNGMNPSNDLQISWEYYDGKQWQRMGLVNPKAVEESLKGLDFDDSTYCLTRNGTVSFTVPEGLSKSTVTDIESYWVRARIVRGDYGVPGTYMLDGDKWAWFDERPLRPPHMKSVRIKYEEPNRSPEKALTYNDFRYTDVTQVLSEDLGGVQIFEPIPDESPSIYFGMNGPFPNERIQMFVNVVAKTSADIVREKDTEAFLAGYYRKMEEQYYGNKKVVWEYWDGRAWLDLGVNDETRAFTETGYIDFLGPREMAPTRKFGENLFWIRVRLEMGGYEELPRINHVMFNTVEAVNRRTLTFEILGSGRGTPNEYFQFMNRPVLEGEELWIREKEMPSAEELAILEDYYGKAKFIDPDPRGDGVWVRWHAVDSFYASGSRSRHYRIDRLNGTVQFGDGTRGMLLPAMDQNIRTTRYAVGGGVRGNIGPNQAKTIRQAIAYIDGVNNLYPAAGGSDVETVEALKLRAPYIIKSRYRAVTKEDFEVLALQSSNAIARSYCLPATEREGEVCVLIIPKFDVRNSDYTEKLVPSTELMRRVKTSLDERRLLTVKVNVERPQYTELSISLEFIRVSTGSSERLKRDIELALRRFLHSIHGGRDGKGWQFGRSVLKVDLYHIIEEVNGVDFVDKIKIFDEDRASFVDQIKLGPKGLPYLVNVDITERARERIV
ncbi:MAG: putative baseplate assembly protein [Bradymonadales bacterium]|jgi:hypothetical protein